MIQPLLQLLVFGFLSSGIAAGAEAGPKTDEKTKGGQGAQAGRTEADDKSSKTEVSTKGSAKRTVDMSDIPPDAAAEEADIAKLGEGFKVFRTMHFSILHNVSDADVKAFSTAIEKTYRSNLNYALTLDIEPKKPARKLIIYYFNEHQAYSDYSKSLGKGERPQSNPGVFFPDLNRSMFYNFRNQDSFKRARQDAEKKIQDLKQRLSGKVSSEQRRQINQEISQAKAAANASGTQGGNQNEETVQHEVTHHILWSIGLHNPKSFPANPRWFAEGTAMMFETAGEGKASNIGAVNKGRLHDYQELEKARKLLDVKQVITNPGLFNQPDVAGTAYAQAWALVHYLNRTKRGQIKSYAEIINKRGEDYQPTPENELAAFEKAFGKLDEKWITQWKTWMKGVR